MTRRGFLKSLLAVSAACVVAPKTLLALGEPVRQNPPPGGITYPFPHTPPPSAIEPPRQYAGWTRQQLEAQLATMGDGRQDCTAIMQAILDYPADLRLPPGRYRVTGNVTGNLFT